MFQVAMLIINFVFAFMAGVVFSAVFGFEWWVLTFFVGFVLWNVATASMLLIVGFVLGNRVEGEF